MVAPFPMSRLVIAVVVCAFAASGFLVFWRSYLSETDVTTTGTAIVVFSSALIVILVRPVWNALQSIKQSAANRQWMPLSMSAVGIFEMLCFSYALAMGLRMLGGR